VVSEAGWTLIGVGVGGLLAWVGDGLADRRMRGDARREERKAAYAQFLTACARLRQALRLEAVRTAVDDLEVAAQTVMLFLPGGRIVEVVNDIVHEARQSLSDRRDFRLNEGEMQVFLAFAHEDLAGRPARLSRARDRLSLIWTHSEFRRGGT
jgi:hypothetical protein